MYTTHFLTDVLTHNLCICLSCFALVSRPHFVGYNLLHVESVESTLESFCAKNPFGESSVF